MKNWKRCWNIRDNEKEIKTLGNNWSNRVFDARYAPIRRATEKFEKLVQGEFGAKLSRREISREVSREERIRRSVANISREQRSGTEVIPQISMQRSAARTGTQFFETRSCVSNVGIQLFPPGWQTALSYGGKWRIIRLSTKLFFFSAAF